MHWEPLPIQATPPRECKRTSNSASWRRSAKVDIRLDDLVIVEQPLVLEPACTELARIAGNIERDLDAIIDTHALGIHGMRLHPIPSRQ